MDELISKSALLKEVVIRKFSEDAKKMNVEYDCEMDGFFRGYVEGMLIFVPTTTEQEIRNKAIDEFIERLNKHEQENWIDHHEYGITWSDIERIAEQMKGGAE